MQPPIDSERAAELIKDGRPYRSCCGTPTDTDHIPECFFFRAVHPPSEQCTYCGMSGFHRPDCPERTTTAENPKHYEHVSGVETINVNRCMTFTAGSAFKYMLRYETKANPPEDLRKGRWYSADVEEYNDPVWISLEHRATALPYLDQMIAQENNDFRLRFLLAARDSDVVAMSSAIEDARGSLA